MILSYPPCNGGMEELKWQLDQRPRRLYFVL